jgi:hypothetical protein
MNAADATLFLIRVIRAIRGFNNRHSSATIGGWVFMTNMTKWEMEMRKTSAIGLILTLAASAAFADNGAATTSPAPAKGGGVGEVPVKRVVLFSSGVGFFEHEGSIEGTAAAPLRFETAQINDVLKSLVVYDRDGGAVRNVTYPAIDPVSKTLKSFQVDLSSNPAMADILSQMRGAGVAISVGDESIEGTILGVEPRERAVGKPDDGKVITTWVVNVISPVGIRAVPLDDMRKLEVKDEKIRKEMAQALAALAQARDQSKKQVTVNFEGTGKRRVGMGYLVETPIWKTSYRLMLPDLTSKDTAKLQGWAIVENQTDNDWNNVALSLVGGKPLGFIELLYQPLYNPRPVVQPDLASTLRPQTYDDGQTGGGATSTITPPTFNLTDITKGGSTGGGGGGSLFTDSSRGGEQGATKGDAMKDYSQGVAAVAQTSKIGEMFHYNVEKVSLQRQQSSMIPIITAGVDFERVSIFNARVLSQRALRGVRLKNNTDKYLLGGPVTVLDTVKEGTSYAGDARITDIPPGQSRLLSYAVDQDLLIDVGSEESRRNLLKATIAKGILHLSILDRMVREYTIQNKSDVEKLVVVEHPITDDYELREPAKVSEKTETAYRLQTPAPGKNTAKVRVVEERLGAERITIVEIDAQNLAYYLKEGGISDKVKQALQSVADKRIRIADLERQAVRHKDRRRRILEEQNNIRENIRVLPVSSKSQQDAINDLSAHDTELKAVTKEIHSLEDSVEQAKAELSKFLAETVIE